jgi:hypothetical protein
MLLVSTELVSVTLFVLPTESEVLVSMAGAFVALDWFSTELFPHPARRVAAQSKMNIFMM